MADRETSALIEGLHDTQARLEAAKDALAAANERIAELHAAFVKLTRETPYPEECAQARNQVGVLTAKVGTLNNELAEARDRIATLERARDAALRDLETAENMLWTSACDGCRDSCKTPEWCEAVRAFLDRKREGGAGG